MLFLCPRCFIVPTGAWAFSSVWFCMLVFYPHPHSHLTSLEYSQMYAAEMENYFLHNCLQEIYSEELRNKGVSARNPQMVMKNISIERRRRKWITYPWSFFFQIPHYFRDIHDHPYSLISLKDPTWKLLSWESGDLLGLYNSNLSWSLSQQQI